LPSRRHTPAIASLPELIRLGQPRHSFCFNISGLFVGVPVKLGAGGIEQVVELPLDAPTNAALQKSAGAVRELVDAMDRIKAEGRRSAGYDCTAPSTISRPLVGLPWVITR